MMADEKPLGLVKFNRGAKAPEHLVRLLREALEAAAAGTLHDCILDFSVDEGAVVDGEGMLTGQTFLWHADDRLDSVLARVDVLHHQALRAIVGDSDA
jgi:hypothetical protein